MTLKEHCGYQKMVLLILIKFVCPLLKLPNKKVFETIFIIMQLIYHSDALISFGGEVVTIPWTLVTEPCTNIWFL